MGTADRTLSAWIKTAESCLPSDRHPSQTIKRSQKDTQIKIVKEGLGVLPGTVVIPFSSVTKQGRDEIWELVESQFLNV